MNARLVAILLAAGGLAGCGQGKPNTAGSATNAASPGGNPLTAPVDYVGAVGRAKHHADKVVDTVQVQHAIQQFHASEDRYPKDLDELVKEGYLPRLPPLPAGLRYSYDSTNGQVKTAPVPQP